MKSISPLALTSLFLGICMFFQPSCPAAATPSAGSSEQEAEKRQAELEEAFKEETSITNSLGMVLVSIPAGFRVAQYEVTQSDYSQIMGTNPSHFSGARRPVEMVTWQEAQSFCRKLTEREAEEEVIPRSYAYVLPDESDFDIYVAETPLSTAIVSLIGDRPFTESVGLLPANPLGLYDVRGNVWEWCSTPVARGASYQSHEDYLATTFRFAGTPDLRMKDIGFRVVLKQVRQP